VTGLQGSGLVELPNLADDIPATNGSFVFPAGLVSGSDYAVTQSQPVDPDQTVTVTVTVTVTNDTGVIAEARPRAGRPRRKEPAPDDTGAGDEAASG
jgi:hypothetical protein